MSSRPQVLSPQSYDFGSPFFEVVLITDGIRFPLWEGPEATAAIESHGASFGYHGQNLAVVQEISIEWQGAYYTITVNLNPNFDDAKALLESKLIQQGYTALEVRIGYRVGVAGGPVYQAFDGVVTEVDFAIGTEITLTLKSVPSPMPRILTQENSQRWTNKSAKDIVKLVWEKHTGNLLDDSNLSSGTEEAQRARQLWEEPMKEYAQGGKTEMALILELVRKASCVPLMYSYQDGKTTFLVIEAQSSRFTAAPVAVFRLFSPQVLPKFGGNWAYPITSCSLKSGNIFARDLEGRLSLGINMETGAPVRQELKPLRSVVIGEPPKSRPSFDGPVTAEVEKNTTTLAIESGKGVGIQMEMESLLIPHLSPYSVVTVEGISSRWIDGNYFITKIFFQVGPDGGSTRWEGTKNDSPVDVATEEKKAEPAEGGAVATPEVEGNE